MAARSLLSRTALLFTRRSLHGAVVLPVAPSGPSIAQGWTGRPKWQGLVSGVLLIGPIVMANVAYCESTDAAGAGGARPPVWDQLKNAANADHPMDAVAQAAGQAVCSMIAIA